MAITAEGLSLNVLLFLVRIPNGIPPLERSHFLRNIFGAVESHIQKKHVIINQPSFTSFIMYIILFIIYIYIYHLVMTNIAMENPNHKYGGFFVGKSSTSIRAMASSSQTVSHFQRKFIHLYLPIC